MKKLIVLIVTFFSFYSNASSSVSYFKIGGLVGLGTTEQMDQYNVVTRGFGYNIAYGTRARSTALEFGISSAELSGDVNQSGITRTGVQDFTIMYLDFYLFLTRSLSMKVGYGLVSFSDYAEGGDDNVFSGLESAYGFKNDTTRGGPRYGFNYDFLPSNKKFNMGAGYTFQQNGDGHEHLFDFSFKWSFQRGITDVFLR